MLPAKLVENAGEDDFKATLTVGHSSECRILALVFEDALEIGIDWFWVLGSIPGLNNLAILNVNS